MLCCDVYIMFMLHGVCCTVVFFLSRFTDFFVFTYVWCILVHRRLSVELSGDAQLKKLREQLKEEQKKVEKLRKVRWCRLYISYYMICACMYAAIINFNSWSCILS